MHRRGVEVETSFVDGRSRVEQQEAAVLQVVPIIPTVLQLSWMLLLHLHLYPHSLVSYVSC